MRTLREIVDTHAGVRAEAKEYYETIIKPKLEACETTEDYQALRIWVCSEVGIDSSQLGVGARWLNDLPPEISTTILLVGAARGFLS